MDNDIFCVLCGGPFALEQHVYRIDPSKKGYQVSHSFSHSQMHLHVLHAFFSAANDHSGYMMSGY